jgi:DNA-binding NtrC family response regulator
MDLVSTAVPHGPLWQGASVLVVDDEAPLRRLIRRNLQLQKFEVEEAEDGESALTLIQARQEPFDLVLTDLKMPRIDGRQLAEVIGLYQPTVAVLCMSADPAGVALIDDSITSTPLLRKPFTAMELYCTVRDTLSHAAELKALAEAEVLQALEGRSRLAAQLEASRVTRKQMLDLVAVARQLRRKQG